MTFQKQLQAARAEARMSQSEASKFLCVPKKTLQNWEQGRNKPAAILQAMIIDKLASEK